MLAELTVCLIVSIFKKYRGNTYFGIFVYSFKRLLDTPYYDFET